MSKDSNRIRHLRIIVIAMIGSLLLTLVPGPRSAEPVHADEPITTAIVIGWVGSAVAGAAVGWVASKFGGDSGSKASCMTTTTTVTHANGGTTTTTTTTCSGSSKTVVPDDHLDEVPPGFRMSETILLQEAPDGSIHGEYRDLNYGTNVLDPVFGQPQSVRYDVERKSNVRFTRPQSAPSNVSSIFELVVSVEGLVLGTTDSATTFGSSRYELTVESPELGVIFQSTVEVPQGGEPIIRGDIPAERFELSAGRAVIPNYGQTSRLFVPSELSVIDLTVTFVTTGEGEILPPLLPPSYRYYPFADIISNDDNLVRVWKFENSTQSWEFFDPRPEFASANSYEAKIGHIVWIKVNEEQDFQGQVLFPGWNLIVLR